MIYKAEAFINLFQFTNSCFHKLELTDYMFVVIKKKPFVIQVRTLEA